MLLATTWYLAILQHLPVVPAHVLVNSVSREPVHLQPSDHQRDHARWGTTQGPRFVRHHHDSLSNEVLVGPADAHVRLHGGQPQRPEPGKPTPLRPLHEVTHTVHQESTSCYSQTSSGSNSPITTNPVGGRCSARSLFSATCTAILLVLGFAGLGRNNAGTGQDRAGAQLRYSTIYPFSASTTKLNLGFSAGPRHSAVCGLQRSHDLGFISVCLCSNRTCF